MVASDTFRSAPMMRNLLVYLWSHKGESLSEYAVALDALGKPADFDPRTDSTVRVQISRLRAKLKEFYEQPGEPFPLKISIPVGRHDLQWTYEHTPKLSPQVPPVPIPRARAIVAGLVFLALALACILLSLRVRALEASSPAGASPLPRFWQTFGAEPKPVVIVLPSPLYFSWPDRGINVRDLSVSDFSKWTLSPRLNEIAAMWGPPQLSQNYVGIPETHAGIRLVQFLQGRVAQLEVIESRRFAADSVGARNTIFIGMPRTAAYLEHTAQKLNFYIERVEPDVIRNRNPRPGEAKEFVQVNYSADRVRYPGIIALLPSRPEHTRSLLLLGRSPAGLATLLSSVDGLRLLDEQWKKGGSPDAWEMIVEADTFRGDIFEKVTPVSFRPIPSDFWKRP